jgi:hypothetical protein
MDPIKANKARISRSIGTWFDECGVFGLFTWRGILIFRPPHLSSPRQVMNGQLIHESVLRPKPPTRAIKARLPKGLIWDADDLEKKMCLEPDPYISAETLLKKLTTGALAPGDRGVLTTLSSSGTHPTVYLDRNCILKLDRRWWSIIHGYPRRCGYAIPISGNSSGRFSTGCR